MERSSFSLGTKVPRDVQNKPTWPMKYSQMQHWDLEESAGPFQISVGRFESYIFFKKGSCQTKHQSKTITCCVFKAATV